MDKIINPDHATGATAHANAKNIFKNALFAIFIIILSSFTVPSNSYAATDYNEDYRECPVCHRCAEYDYTGLGCIECVYDVNYCDESECEEMECADGEEFNQDTCMCEGGGGGVAVDCDEGSYQYLDSCATCPTYSNCNISSPAGSMFITNCYAVANSCSISDGTGTYTYTSNCNYVDDDGSEEEIPL
jgi:hypothetical protein